MTRMTGDEIKLLEQAKEVVDAELRKQEQEARYYSAEGIAFRMALKLIDTPEKWCKCQEKLFVGRFAIIDWNERRRLEEGSLFIGDGNAVCDTKIEYKTEDRYQYCSIGALRQVSNKQKLQKLHDALQYTISRHYPFSYYSIASFNDRHTHSEVMEMWNACGKENGWL